MKIDNNLGDNVETFGVSAQNSFSINASAQAFSILSDGLYSDKIHAIIRELSCNAYDAHVAAGHPEKPFNVQFPNSIVPEFVIRDYGTGLSHEDVMNLYTTYFGSTKTGSNDFIGALGLGSKSPFSYTKSFTVISYFDGKKMTFTAFIGEDGTPQIAHMFTEPTDDLVGLEVRFGVKENDHYQFSTRAQRVYRFFKTVPNITGIEFKIDEYETAVEGDGWRLLERNNHRDGIYAVQGNIGYPINVSRINFDHEKESAIYTLLKSSYIPMEIEFQIGDLQFAASREELGYDDVTQENIKKRCSEVLLDMADVISNSLASASTLWEVYIKIAEIKNIYGQTIIDAMSDKFSPTWNGIAVSEATMKIDIINFATSLGYDKWINSSATINLATTGTYLPLVINKFIPPEDGKYWRKYSTKQRRSVGNAFHLHETVLHVNPSMDVKIIVDDVKKRGIYSRIISALSDNQWRKDNGFKNQPVGLFEFVNDSEQEAFLNLLGNPPVVKLSELPINKSTSTRMDQVMFHYSDQHWNVRDRWKSDKGVILEKGGIYVALNAFLPYKKDGDKWDASIFRSIVSNAVSLGLLKSFTDVKGLRHKHIKEFNIENDPNWIEISDYLEKEVMKKLKWTNLGKRIAYDSQDQLGDRSAQIRDLDCHNKNWNLLDENTELRKFINRVRGIKGNVPKIRAPKAWLSQKTVGYNDTWDRKLTTLAENLTINVKLIFGDKVQSLGERYDIIAEKYPLVCAIDWDQWYYKKIDLTEPKPILPVKDTDPRVSIEDIRSYQVWRAVVQIKD